MVPLDKFFLNYLRFAEIKIRKKQFAVLPQYLPYFFSLKKKVTNLPAGRQAGNLVKKNGIPSASGSELTFLMHFLTGSRHRDAGTGTF